MCCCHWSLQCRAVAWGWHHQTLPWKCGLLSKPTQHTFHILSTGINSSPGKNLRIMYSSSLTYRQWCSCFKSVWGRAGVIDILISKISKQEVQFRQKIYLQVVIPQLFFCSSWGWAFWMQNGDSEHTTQTSLMTPLLHIFFIFLFQFRSFLLKQEPF